MLSFKNLKIKYKIWAIVILAVLSTVVLQINSASILKNQLFEEKKYKTRNVVETASSILQHYYNSAKEGKLAEEDAKKQALLAIKSLRYDEKEYFWINDTTLPYPKMIMHPTIPALEGKFTDDPIYNTVLEMQAGLTGKIEKTDGKKNILQAAVEVCNKAGEGFLLYRWPKPISREKVTKETYPKLSFVKKFEPWGWIIGSGIYIDDIEALFFKRVRLIIFQASILSIF